MYQGKVVQLIAAIANNGVIGTSDGKIPWQGLVPSDMARFRNLTTSVGSNSVVMGHKTWKSLPPKFRPLPNRENIVVSRNQGLEINLDDEWKTAADKPILVAHSIEEAIEKAVADTVWIMGGCQIYEQAMPYVDELHITQICGEFIGDIRFPYKARDQYKWSLIESEDYDEESEKTDRIYSRYCIFRRS